MNDRKIIIVKRKKKGGHGGHHGGSWKVAYADFVTAMMAFFLVMWIMGMDQGARDLVQGYFQNPVGFKRAFSGGKNPMSAGNFITNIEVKRTVILNRKAQEEAFRLAAEGIDRGLAEAGLADGIGGAVDMVVTDEGLRIELMDVEGGANAFFDRSSSELKPVLVEVLQVVGSVLGEFPGDIVLEGHTDAVPYPGESYSNWELSVDRANAARRELVDAGLPIQRLVEVRGYADRHLRVFEDPEDPQNRRITVLLPFVETDLSSLLVPGVDVEAVLKAASTRGIGT